MPWIVHSDVAEGHLNFGWMVYLFMTLGCTAMKNMKCGYLRLEMKCFFILFLVAVAILLNSGLSRSIRPQMFGPVLAPVFHRHFCSSALIFSSFLRSSTSTPWPIAGGFGNPGKCFFILCLPQKMNNQKQNHGLCKSMSGTYALWIIMEYCW